MTYTRRRLTSGPGVVEQQQADVDVHFVSTGDAEVVSAQISMQWRNVTVGSCGLCGPRATSSHAVTLHACCHTGTDGFSGVIPSACVARYSVQCFTHLNSGATWNNDAVAKTPSQVAFNIDGSVPDCTPHPPGCMTCGCACKV